MESTLSLPCPEPAARWRELVMPKEHGSWSLAFEPLAFGLLVAPSAAGAFLAGTIAAAFFCRRPLRIAVMDARPARRASARTILVALGAVAAVALAGAIALGGADWLRWLAPSLLAGGVFAIFDVRNAGHEEAAEVAGAAAFAWLPAVFAILDGASPLAAVAVATVMIGRAVPTVLCVRAVLRGGKTGERHVALPLFAAAAALAGAIAFARAGVVPFTAVVLLGLLGLRSIALLVFPRPALRGRTLGMIETALGVAFVIAAAGAWVSFSPNA
ncbi:MAG: YwiC-like family protein [Opitutaceae bacterium]|nr:YwiC-like family protein [Opitutaceae bacterium]